jgi:16S rRNA (cytidine1402-2'-O)-methyltransferase
VLTLVATPIGNLKDLSQRALEALQQADLILCEDTRRSRRLLDHYAVRAPLRSYHAFNERRMLPSILERLARGEAIVLISDAGTPTIQDPGALLVRTCIERDIPWTAIPGACSIIQALLLSGMASERFQYVGFLPKPPTKLLRDVLNYPGTTIAFESPHRLSKTLQILAALDPTREIAVVREMTKIFEECRRGTPAALLAHFRTSPPKGEIVLLICAKIRLSGITKAFE